MILASLKGLVLVRGAEAGEVSHMLAMPHRGWRLKPDFGHALVYSSHRGSRDIEHIGSAQGDVRLGVLKAAAWQRMAAGQSELTPAVTAGCR